MLAPITLFPIVSFVAAVPGGGGSIAVWVISIARIICMLLRPRGIVEAWWVSAGAFILLIGGFIPFAAALHAVREGVNVYLFLTGMMLLAALARREGVFDWLADLATHHAGGSATRLFILIYLVGIAVTVLLSNDATAVVLTPAVYAAVKRAQARPMPYLFACAFISNAASFVLPISNPANLVVFGRHMPHLAEWVGIFAIPSLISIVVTFATLWWISRDDLKDVLEGDAIGFQLSSAGRYAALGLLLAAVVLMTASAFGWNLGLPTCGAALIAVGLVIIKDRSAPLHIFRDVSWSVLPLVAGLFVIVEALNRAGALRASRHALHAAAQMPRLLGGLTAAFGTGLISNLMNNLPVGLASSAALHQDGIPAQIAHSVLIGVDLGPNLSVTGSLATVLWLIALRREGVRVSAWTFFKAGLIVMPFALAASVLVLVPR